MIPDSFSEFAVEVDGVGFVWGSDHPPFDMMLQTDLADVFTDADDAYRIAEKVASMYRSLGQSEMFDRVHVRARTATVVREEWREPIAVSTVAAHAGGDH